MNYIVKKILKTLPDKLYLQLLYFKHFQRCINFTNPQTFNEKLQWLKIYDRKSIYTTMVDKYEAKKYVADIIGEEHIIPTIAVYDKVEDIDFSTLPNQFVMKWNHDSGSIIICKDKSKFNKKAAIEKLRNGAKFNGFWYGREWPYKNVKPKVIIEKFMTDDSQKELGLKDYKFYCFNGEAKYLYVSEGLDNHSTARISFLTMDWQFAPFGRTDFAPFEELPPKPSMFDEMIKIANKLSEGHPFLRVDLYQINKQIYFGELTLYPCSGIMPFYPAKYDNYLGDLIKLPYQTI